MTLTQFISSNNLRPADAVELACPQAGFPKHYAVYLGFEKGFPQFIANITDGIQILSIEKLTEFVKRYQVTKIERFNGDHQKRANAVKRAMSRIGENAYNIVFNNCEHFKNWVLNGEGISKQAASIGTGVALAGVGIFLLGAMSESKTLKKTGTLIILIFIVILISAFIYWRYRQNSHDDFQN
jgi:hypothetical protein